MKVLVTGGYGFIGSHVAERFHQEGYDVIIIDNLTTGKKENVSFKHNSYILSIEDSKCEEIFRSHKIDVAVHLAAQVSVANSVTDPTYDAESNIVGLVNILNLAAKYDVKKFLYASSAAVYGLQTKLPITEQMECAPISPYGISKLSGELYCEKWGELYGLETLGFRFSNVYGPRQDGLGEGGVISIFMNRLLTEQPLIVLGDGEQTRDFIYVEDVAFAIYRGANSTQTGVYNLSVNKQTSVNRIIEVMDAIQPITEVIYKEKRVGDIDHSVLDNQKLMHDLDWSPLYTIEEGLSKTASYFMKERAELQAVVKPAVSPKRIKARQVFDKILPTLENVVAFGLIAWLTLIYPNSGSGMIDLKLFYITIIGMMHGSRQAMTAVVLSTGLFIYQKLEGGRDFISLTYDTDFFFQLAIYLFVGLVVGYTIERKNTTIKQQEYKVDELNNRYEFLDSVYTDVRDVKNELQTRILNAGDSYGKIYAATKELESLEPEHVFNSAVSVVKSIMQVEKVKIYIVNPHETYLRLIASSGYDLFELPKSLKVSEHEYVNTTIKSGQIYINGSLQDDVPLMVAPLFYNDKVTAIISIDGLSFESFSMYHQNLFRITTELISSALSKAFTHITATESQRYFENSMIMKPQVFNEIVASKKKMFEEYNVPYLLLNAERYDLSNSDTADYLSTKLRETDYLGLDEEGNLLVLLSNTSMEDREKIVNRLTHDSMIFTALTEE
ncbi:NAD-dependent epimerase/dehydratase family protein [Sporosarcina oncorhynchi]|uniref:NAD-dependent epimerase/dehydratase family protein n=1 Tax=Sporosarcina oncorhynchi TaxID=3056444 RepID=A0ABZ0L2I9_9BACL|nr:NAD-dependent epimerase/dehydratase family protein [Sporosarcina sp. T2O-4]WOV86830.1 NAD-dependent epimerase/dehydratase family protein [Sporosarcina sp. T2O-4]